MDGYTNLALKSYRRYSKRRKNKKLKSNSPSKEKLKSNSPSKDSLKLPKIKVKRISLNPTLSK